MCFELSMPKKTYNYDDLELEERENIFKKCFKRIK